MTPRPPAAPCSPRDLLATGCDAVGFDHRAAYAAARVASAVYRADAVQAMAGAGWHGAQLFGMGPTQVMVAWSPEVTVIVGRGTDERGDWWDNIRTCRAELPEAFGRFAGLVVHRGFLGQVTRLLEPVLATVLQQHHRGSKLMVQGHSLGAPTATLLALALVDRVDVPIVDYTFNSPRWLATDSLEEFGKLTVGWSGYRSLDIKRIVSTTQGVFDIIPRVPPERWGWTHVGELVILDGPHRFIGSDAWQLWRAWRAEDPLGNIAAWRVLTRLRRGVEAHRWWTLVDQLRRQI